jgi:type I restriction enzyme S subunit
MKNVHRTNIMRRGEVPSPCAVSPDIKGSSLGGESGTEKNKGGGTPPLQKELPEGWTIFSLGEISEKPQYGWTTKANHEKGRLKLLRTTDITSGTVNWSNVPYCTEEPENIEKYLVKSGDILISRAGSIGVSYLVNNPERAVFASYLIRFRPKQSMDEKYIYYYLKSPDYWTAIGTSKVGIAVPNVNATKLSQVPIPLASPAQQKLIVAEIEKQFSRLDEAVAALKRIQANLKRYKASVLTAAVEGKLTEEWRSRRGMACHAPTKDEIGADLLKRILVERRKKWEEDYVRKYVGTHGHAPKDDSWKKKYKEPAVPDTSNLPELPKGWVWATIDQISVVVRGASPRPAGNPKYFGGTIPWITVGPITIDEKPYLHSVPETVTVAGRARSRYIEPQTLLLTNSGATLGVPKITLIGGCINDGVAAILDVEYPLKLYLFYFLLTKTKRLRGINQGAAQPNLNTTIIKAIFVPLPPVVEQQQILAEIEHRLSVSEEIEAIVGMNLKRAERLRQSILKKAFSGRLIPHSQLREHASA